MDDFTELLRKLLICDEFKHTEEDADRLIKSYPMIVAQGIIKGNFALRATAMALEMKDQEPKR